MQSEHFYRSTFYIPLPVYSHASGDPMKTFRSAVLSTPKNVFGVPQ